MTAVQIRELAEDAQLPRSTIRVESVFVDSMLESKGTIVDEGKRICAVPTTLKLIAFLLDGTNPLESLVIFLKQGRLRDKQVVSEQRVFIRSRFRSVILLIIKTKKSTLRTVRIVAHLYFSLIYYGLWRWTRWFKKLSLFDRVSQGATLPLTLMSRVPRIGLIRLSTQM